MKQFATLVFLLYDFREEEYKLFFEPEVHLEGIEQFYL